MQREKQTETESKGDAEMTLETLESTTELGRTLTDDVCFIHYANGWFIRIDRGSTAWSIGEVESVEDIRRQYTDRGTFIRI